MSGSAKTAGDGCAWRLLWVLWEGTLIAEFSHYAPEGVTTPKAILVIVPHSQSDGRDWINEPEWVEFATTHSLALVGCHFKDDHPGWIEDYCNVRESESGERLLAYLYDKFGLPTPGSDRAGLPPILLWGYSAGGQFAFEFSVRYPLFVAGFVVNKGGVYYTALTPPATRKIPALFVIGLRDARSRINILRGILELNRKAGAKWFHFEENLAHDYGQSGEAGRQFFEGVLKEMS